jgi:hypothetical protein
MADGGDERLAKTEAEETKASTEAEVAARKAEVAAICSRCGIKLLKANFSKKQLKKNPSDPRCNACRAAETYFCPICKVTLISIFEKEQHLLGKKHLKAEKFAAVENVAVQVSKTKSSRQELAAVLQSFAVECSPIQQLHALKSKQFLFDFNASEPQEVACADLYPTQSKFEATLTMQHLGLDDSHTFRRQGTSKKDAKRNAARAALDALASYAQVRLPSIDKTNAAEYRIPKRERPADTSPAARGNESSRGASDGPIWIVFDVNGTIAKKSGVLHSPRPGIEHLQVMHTPPFPTPSALLHSRLPTPPSLPGVRSSASHTPHTTLLPTIICVSPRLSLPPPPSSSSHTHTRTGGSSG